MASDTINKSLIRSQLAVSLDKYVIPAIQDAYDEEQRLTGGKYRSINTTGDARNSLYVDQNINTTTGTAVTIKSKPADGTRATELSLALFGLSPGTFPSADDLEEWAMIKNIKPETTKDIDSMLFLIARHIYNNGIIPSRNADTVVRRGVEKGLPFVQNDLSNIFGQEVRRIFNSKITQTFGTK